MRAELRPRPAGLAPVHAAAAYAGPLREALVAFKDHGRWTLRAPLGDLLARAVSASLLEAGVGRCVLVPVPSSGASVRERDGDHVRELAVRAASSLRRAGVGVRVVPALASVGPRRDQVGLGRDARAANVAGTVRATSRALALRDADLAVVLVDDLVTTGSTLSEATRALAEVRVLPRGSAVVAAARLRSVGALEAARAPGAGLPG